MYRKRALAITHVRPVVVPAQSRCTPCHCGIPVAVALQILIGQPSNQACVVLHNFLMIMCPKHGFDHLAEASSGFEEDVGEDHEPYENDGINVVSPHYTPGDTSNTWRDNISKGMHQDYIQYLVKRSERAAQQDAQSDRDRVELAAAQTNSQRAVNIQRANLVTEYFTSAARAAERASDGY